MQCNEEINPNVDLILVIEDIIDEFIRILCARVFCAQYLIINRLKNLPLLLKCYYIASDRFNRLDENL